MPLLTRAMEAGYVREQDPLALGHWIARLTFTCLLAPPPGDLLTALDAILIPMLTPVGDPPRTRRVPTKKESHRA